jgi:hypothetical protein
MMPKILSGIDPTAELHDCSIGRYTEVGARTRLLEVELSDYSYVVNDSDILMGAPKVLEVAVSKPAPPKSRGRMALEDSDLSTTHGQTKDIVDRLVEKSGPARILRYSVGNKIRGGSLRGGVAL